MSLAWTAVALSVLLLPGFCFFVGLYIPEDFTRDSTAPSPLGQLAAVVLVSLVVHGVGFVLFGWIPWVPAIRLDYLFAILQLAGGSVYSLAELSANVSRFALWILAYVLGSAAVGTYLGYTVGHMIVTGPLTRLAVHEWVFELWLDGRDRRRFWPFGHLRDWWTAKRRKTSRPWSAQVTTAYVLTKVREGNRCVAYRGRLFRFGVGPNGCPSYVVLKNAQRMFMFLDGDAPKMTKAEHWATIGKESLSTGLSPRPAASHLVIAGDEIANVVFDRIPLRVTSEGLDALMSAMRARREVRQQQRELPLKRATIQKPPTAPKRRG